MLPVSDRGFNDNKRVQRVASKFYVHQISRITYQAVLKPQQQLLCEKLTLSKLKRKHLFNREL